MIQRASLNSLKRKKIKKREKHNKEKDDFLHKRKEG